MNETLFKFNIEVKRSFWERMGGWIILSIAFIVGSLVGTFVNVPNFWVDLCLCTIILGLANFFWHKWIKCYNYFIFNYESMIKLRNKLNEAIKEAEDEAKAEEALEKVEK